MQKAQDNFRKSTNAHLRKWRLTRAYHQLHVQRRRSSSTKDEQEALKEQMAALEEEERLRFSAAAQVKGSDVEGLFEKYMRKHLEEAEDEYAAVIADVS